ncbi:hypothetical protein Rsub_06238 [Raphidocelis subcapitata]|uniref:C3H1-type domain-containing protein n=1 Tax=Raphidocelis subcapitata TaxID=307507 RepID=A0A2V0P328_9CHLO|nr:hypothetical protein Rsub_06238 [Raphidocelis subcapitata]|eukprot:GBF93989.1 hypothetical protein Rsub_06238 [Raphidocelis subcapitata]
MAEADPSAPRGPAAPRDDAEQASHRATSTAERRETADDRRECSFYLRTGTCAYGAHCRFSHPAVRPRAELNASGLPLRPGEPDCSYYLRRGVCAFGLTCKFHHPEIEGDDGGAGGGGGGGDGDGDGEPPPEQPASGPPQAYRPAAPACPTSPAPPAMPRLVRADSGGAAAAAATPAGPGALVASPLRAAAVVPVVASPQLVYYTPYYAPYPPGTTQPGVSVFPMPPVVWYGARPAGMPMGQAAAMWPPRPPAAAYAAAPLQQVWQLQGQQWAQASPTRSARHSSSSVDDSAAESGAALPAPPRLPPGADAKARSSAGSEGLAEPMRGLALRTSSDQLPGADQLPPPRAALLQQEPLPHRRTVSAPLPAQAVAPAPSQQQQQQQPQQPQQQQQQRRPRQRQQSQQQEPRWQQNQGYGS